MSERRPGFGRPDEEYIRGFEYDSPRYPNGAPRSYHGDDQRGYYGENSHFANERRSGPLRRVRAPPAADRYTQTGVQAASEPDCVYDPLCLTCRLATRQEMTSSVLLSFVKEMQQMLPWF